MATREYRNDRITVHWDSQRCIHTAICLQSLPEVFEVHRQPWVDVDAATAEQIAEAVRRCPTGALRYELEGQPEEAPDTTTVTPVLGGPLLLRGPIRLRDHQGNVYHETRLDLCRCGASENKPFCDNSHLRTGFEGMRLRPPGDRDEAQSTADIGPSQESGGVDLPR